MPDFVSMAVAASGGTAGPQGGKAVTGQAITRLKAAWQQQQQQPVQAGQQPDSCQHQEQQQQPRQLQRQQNLQRQLDIWLAEAAALPQRLQGVLLLKLPVLPPSRAQTDAWLAARGLAGQGRSTGQRNGAAVKSLGGAADRQQQQQQQVTLEAPQTNTAMHEGAIAAAAAAVSATPVDFIMDVNSGKFVPVTAAATTAAAAAAAYTPAKGLGNSNGSSFPAAALTAATPRGAAAAAVAAAEEDAELGLLATPALLLSATTDGSQSDLNEQQQQQQNNVTTAVSGFASPDGERERVAGSSNGGWEQQEQQDLDEYEEPASPKYDERTFFFSGTTKAHKKRHTTHGTLSWRSAGRRGTEGAQQQPGTRLEAAAATSLTAAGSAPNVTPASLHLPGSSEHITPPQAAPAAAAKQQQQHADVGNAAGKTPSQMRFKQQQQQGKRKQGEHKAADHCDVIIRPELNILAVEIHADSRGALLPDPR
jgi:hypothetical protein